MDNWELLVTSIEDAVHKLKDKANTVYDREVALSSSCSGQERRNLRLESALHVVGRGRSPLNTQRSESRARSLKELTDDATIFAVLHVDMAILLRRIMMKTRLKNARHPCLNGLEKIRGTGSCIRKLYSMIGKDKFRRIAYNAVTGKQVLIQSNCPTTANKVLQSISFLLPDPSVRITFDAETYFSRHFCNLISIPKNVQLPPHVLDALDVILLDLKQEDDGDTIKVTIHDKGRFPDKLPRYLTDIERVIRDTTFSDQSLDYYIESCKLDWIEKAKIVSAIKTSLIDQKAWNPDNILTQVKRMTGLDMSDQDTPLLLFWMHHALQHNHRIHTNECNRDRGTSSSSSSTSTPNHSESNVI